MTGDGFDEPLPVRLVRRLEAATSVDRLDQPLVRLAAALLASRRRANLLQGRWIGHALHPLLTDLPLGSWTSMSILDLLGGRESRQDAERLLVVGLAAAGPTALTGLAEWGQTSVGDRRVGFVHAVGNTAAVGLYGASYVARRRGRHRAGVMLGLAGAGVVAAAGYLGSHLSLARRVATRHPVFEAPVDAGNPERVAVDNPSPNSSPKYPQTGTLEYRVPDPQDPVDLLAALTRAGYAATEVGRGGVRYVSIVLPDEPDLNHRERARRAIADADEASAESPRLAPDVIVFEDER